MVKNRQKTKTSLIPCVWNFLELLLTKEQYNPAIFIPHLTPIKTQEFGLNHRSSYRWPDPPSGKGKNDSSITVTQFQIFQSFIHHLFSIFPHHKTV